MTSLPVRFWRLLQCCVVPLVGSVEMPSSCAVFGCNNRKSGVTRHLRFFPFPKNLEMCRVWVQKCYRSDKFNPKTHTICSSHFTTRQYEDNLKMRVINPNNSPDKQQCIPKLKQDASPDINLPCSVSKFLLTSDSGELG